MAYEAHLGRANLVGANLIEAKPGSDLYLVAIDHLYMATG
jgi:hypothetical protein